MGMIAATLLLFCDEEDVFWMMISIIEDVLPSAYYSSSLWGAQTDQQVLTSLLATHLPSIYTNLTNHSIDLSLITMSWFLTLFSSTLHIKILLRIWDILFFEGRVGKGSFKIINLRIHQSWEDGNVASFLENNIQINRPYYSLKGVYNPMPRMVYN